MWASISEGEDEDTCTLILQDKCREAVREEYLKLIKKAPPAEIFKVNGDAIPEFIPEGEEE